MRDLYRCLDKHSPRLLQAIAEAWHVSLVGNEQRGWVLSLAEAMLAPGALEGVVERFTPQARDALAELAREGGMLPSHRLSTRYGSIRRFGPARLARERPWLEPKNPLEELFYQGIIYRAYDSVYDYYGEVLLVPQQLLAQLSPTDAPAPAFRVQPAEMPARVQQDGDALGEDLLALVAQVRQGQVPASEENAAVRLTWPAPGYVNLGPRLLGESDPERLALIHRLLQRLRLVEPSQGFLRPTIQAQQWLRFSDLRRLRATYLAWRDDPLWDELRLLPSLRCENTGWQNDPVASRRSLLETLAKCSPGDWLSLDSFVEALKRYHPDYLRPDGDYDSWFIRDAQTGDYLEGFESWERVEGALARHIITRPLRWLGALDLGYGGDREPSSFRITERGGALLADEGDPRTEGQTARSPLARVTEDLWSPFPWKTRCMGATSWSVLPSGSRRVRRQSTESRLNRSGGATTRG